MYMNKFNNKNSKKNNCWSEQSEGCIKWNELFDFIISWFHDHLRYKIKDIIRCFEDVTLKSSHDINSTFLFLNYKSYIILFKFAIPALCWKFVLYVFYSELIS